MLKLLKGVPAPILLVIVSFLLPTELSLYAGTMRLPPYRVVLLLLLPVVIIRFFWKREMKPHLFDVCFLLYNVWTLGIYIHHHGDQEGLQTGGSLALDGFASYFVARVFIRDREAFVGTIGTLVAAITVTGILAMPEAIGGDIYIHNFLREVTGYVHPIGIERRLGLTRAYGTFDHPIHLGTFCASGLAMILYATGRAKSRKLRTGIIALSALTGLSSAPILSLGLQTAMLVWDRVTRGIPGRLAMSLGALAAVFGVVWAVGTRSPFNIIATGMTIDPWTGYYRLMIWENGLLNVWENPWTGLGLNDWKRPDWMFSSTVDAFWLVIAMRAGIPAFILLSLAIILIGRSTAKGMPNVDPEVRRMAMGWMMSLIALSLIACTVHFWNVLYAYFFFFLGLAGWLADPQRQTRAVKAKAGVSMAAKSAPKFVTVPGVPYPVPAALHPATAFRAGH